MNTQTMVHCDLHTGLHHTIHGGAEPLVCLELDDTDSPKPAPVVLLIRSTTFLTRLIDAAMKARDQLHQAQAARLADTPVLAESF